jgi:CcmD family protein
MFDLEEIMLLHSSPAETTGYMVLGLASIFIPMLVYVLSLASRRKRLLKELDSLQELEKI